MSDTPLFDDWREKLKNATEERGAKVELAEGLARHTGITPESARVRIHRILGGVEPTAEILLFLDGQISKKSKSARLARA